jgi:hypothetical protein
MGAHRKKQKLGMDAVADTPAMRSTATPCFRNKYGTKSALTPQEAIPLGAASGANSQGGL